MKYLIPFLLCALCASCVTSVDLQRITDKLADVEYVASQGGDIEQAFAALGKEVDDVAREVEQRGRGIEDMLAEGGAVGLLTAFGLNMYRNHTRKKALSEVQHTAG